MTAPTDEPDNHVEAALARLRAEWASAGSRAARRDAYFAEVRRKADARALVMDIRRDERRAEKENLAAQQKAARFQAKTQEVGTHHA